MLRFILVLSCAAVAFGQLLEEAHPAPEPYSFAFSSPNDDGTSSSRQETGDASGRITGSYTILGADGQQRRVEYVADQDGFRANVITNEIGTESQNPGDVQLVSSAPTAAELTAQWEASGAGKALRGLGGPAIVARPAGIIGGPARGAIAINRGVGLVAAPVAPVAPAIVAGGLVPGRGLRLGQGFGIRAQGIAPIGAAIGAPIGGPVGGLAIHRGVGIAAPVAPPVAAVQVAPKLTGFGVAGVAPVGLNGLGVNQLGLGVAPLGVQNYGGLGLSGNLGGVPDASVLLLSRGQLAPQLSGASNVVARKY